MTDTIIHIDGETAAGVLDEHGWTQGSYGRTGAVCLHGRGLPRLMELRDYQTRRVAWIEIR